MPPSRPNELVDAILDGINQSGESAVVLSVNRQHPRRFAVTAPDGSGEIWVYAWTLTPGGRPQLANEYRIQMTSVTSPLRMNPDGPTVLMGYEPGLRVFGGFDIARHRTFTTGSPSVQIDLASLRLALQDGFAFHRKSNNEITVAVRPDQFMAYVRNAADLHHSGKHQPMLRVLQKAAALQQITPTEFSALGTQRQRLVQTICRLSRAANFADQVLAAYGHRCAVTRVQLRLVDAAHILPVAAPESTDHVTNGIGLAPSYHRAYDAGLIYLDDGYVMRVNPRRLDVLGGLGLSGGIEQFRAPLGRIHLPPDRGQWPDVSFIRRANGYRRIET